MGLLGRRRKSTRGVHGERYNHEPMPDESKTDLRLETAHVLFMDIVGHSKLIDEQPEALHELSQIVRNTEAARAWPRRRGTSFALRQGTNGADLHRLGGRCLLGPAPRRSAL